MLATWDIFCNVIDNYGDIGVCWRLARLLANEHGLAVRCGCGWIAWRVCTSYVRRRLPGRRSEALAQRCRSG